MNARVGTAIALVLAFTTSQAAAQPGREAQDPNRARELFERGVQLMDNQDWGAALIQLEESFRLRPTQVGLFNIGLCLKGLRRYTEAIAAFERLVAEFGDRGSRERVALGRQEAASLRALLGTLRITVNVPGAELLVDGSPVGTSPLAEPIQLAGGSHTIQARLAGYDPAEAQVALVAGSTVTTNLDLRESPPPPRPPAAAPGEPAESIGRQSRAPRAVPRPAPSQGLKPLWFWSVVGLGAAATATTAILGGLVVAGDAEYRDSDPKLTSEREAGHRLALYTDIALGVAVLSAIAAVILYGPTEFGGHDDSNPTAARGQRLLPHPEVGGWSVAIIGAP